MKTIISSFVFLLLQLIFISSTSLAQSACKGLAKGACSSKSTCSWVKSFTNKNGTKVSGHCRKKPGKGTAASKKKSKTSETKASSGKKKSVSKTKNKSETKKKKSKKKDKKKKSSKKKDKKKKKKSKKKSSE